MIYPLSILSLVLLALIHITNGHPQTQDISQEDPIPFSTRAHWMRRANAALAELDSPCPFAAFGTVIVNHSDTSQSPLGNEICISVNQNMKIGNPTLHGEISGINNCSALLTDPEGEYKLSSREALAAFRDLSLYTNAEPCPMCASAIRWSGFAECIFGTSISTLVAKRWTQISISTEELFQETDGLPTKTRLVQEVLSNETDPYFSWQFDHGYPCPSGCERTSSGKSCHKRAAEEAGKVEL